MAVDQVIHYAAMGASDSPRMLHRADCPHQDVGKTQFRSATQEELRVLPECSDCARKDRG
jgi:hypothetical protein